MGTKKRATKAKAKDREPLSLLLPVPGIGDALTPTAARKFVKDFRSLLDFAAVAASSAEAGEERSACSGFQYALGQALEGAQDVLRTLKPRRVKLEDRATECARVLAHVLTAYGRNGEDEICASEAHALTVELAKLLERECRERREREAAERKDRPTREQALERIVQLDREADALERAAKREEQDETERLTHQFVELVAVKVRPKRERIAAMRHEVAELEHRHFSGPKPAPLASAS